MYWKSDSTIHTTTLMAAMTSNWPKRSSMPNSRDTKESFPCTMTSTAAPMSSSGATSATLLTVVATAAHTMRLRWPTA